MDGIILPISVLDMIFFILLKITFFPFNLLVGGAGVHLTISKILGGFQTNKKMATCLFPVCPAIDPISSGFLAKVCKKPEAECAQLLQLDKQNSPPL